VRGSVVLRALAGAPGSQLEGLLGDGLRPLGSLRGARGGFERVVAAMSGIEEAEAGAGLPAGAARAEAIAVRLREGGAAVDWGEPVMVGGVDELLDLCRERGRSSVELLAADPTLLAGMQLGSWFDAGWKARARRRLALGPGRGLTGSARRSEQRLRAAADLAFWEGVRARADARLWRRLTRDSYVALVYHRFAGELKPGQERIDIAPRRFDRQLRALRIAGFRPVSAERLVDFHAGGDADLPRRGVVITVDDGMADCVGPLGRQAGWEPQLFVPTAELGGEAHWIGGEPVAGWEEIVELEQRGVGIGSHARHHHRLSPLDRERRRQELEGSREDLRERLARPLPLIAFPNGDHDAELCAEAAAAGYRAAYTTEKGRNGAGTDVHCLKRVSVHGHDGVAAILWKALTGEGLPAPWRRLRDRRHPPQGRA
jgi:peptidoglycan/xylan/chitin deacetylase (PgdA/CDA1 family)